MAMTEALLLDTDGFVAEGRARTCSWSSGHHSQAGSASALRDLGITRRTIHPGPRGLAANRFAADHARRTLSPTDVFSGTAAEITRSWSSTGGASATAASPFTRELQSRFFACVRFRIRNTGDRLTAVAPGKLA